MTCREFKHYAASLSLLELAKMESPQLAEHTQACAACESWLQKQRTLNSQLHALRTRTSGLEAGADVERELLRVFRQGIPVGRSTSSAEAATIGVRGALETLRPHHEAGLRSTPFALRLSRLFEVGAYAALAAALVIAIFLGAHLLRRNADTRPLQSRAVPERTAPVGNQRTSRLDSSRAEAAVRNSDNAAPRRREARSAHPTLASQRPSARLATDLSDAAAADDSQNYADAGYTALMLCDPLSCASDTQVVRMELPSAAGQGGQQPMADVVVGYDGVVRAVRFLN